MHFCSEAAGGGDGGELSGAAEVVGDDENWKFGLHAMVGRRRLRRLVPPYEEIRRRARRTAEKSAAARATRPRSQAWSFRAITSQR